MKTDILATSTSYRPNMRLRYVAGVMMEHTLRNRPVEWLDGGAIGMLRQASSLEGPKSCKKRTTPL
ncbi:MAG: hypothetical protein OXF02_07405 [Simkaniaceae bacterium]|nr:hypothetical protein [Simkaniaceae bacterium]